MKKLMALLLSVVMIFCFTFTVAYAEPIVDGENEDKIESEEPEDEDEDEDEDDDDDEDEDGDEEDEEDPKTTIEVDGNAIDNIDESTINAVRDILEADLCDGETSELTIIAEEGSINDCTDATVEEELDTIFDDVFVPIEKTFLTFSVIQEIYYDDGDYMGPYGVDDLKTTLDIVYTLPTNTSLKAVVCSDGFSCSKLERLDVAPDIPEAEEFSYFIDGSVVHIYTQSLSLVYGFGFADGIFEVTFNANGGNEAFDSIYTSQLDELPEPTRSEEWEFVDWLYDDGTVAKPGDVIASDVELTAKWKRLGETIPTKNGVLIMKNGDGKATVTLIDGSAYGKKADINTIVGKDKKTYKITRIADEAFENDRKITEVIIGPNVKSIGDYAFYGCERIRDLTIGSGVEELGFGAFANCDGVSSLKFNARDIPDGLFANSDISKLTLGPNVRTIGENAFTGAKITKLKTNKVISIGSEAFLDCENLVSLNIGNSLETVGEAAFAGCVKLRKLSIGSGLDKISNYAFDDCIELSELTIDMADIPSNMFANYNITKITIGPNVRNIGDSAFEGCEMIKKVSFNRVENIGYRAFADSGITTLNTRRVKTIGEEAFSDCPNLTSVTVSDSTKSIGCAAFGSCSKLKSVSIGSGMEDLETNAFVDTDNFIKLSINMANIPGWAFTDQNITTLTLGSNVRTIGDGAFIDCTRLKTININSKHLTDPGVLGDDFLQDIKPKATIKIPSKVFKKTKAAFMEKSGAGDFIKYRKK